MKLVEDVSHPSFCDHFGLTILVDFGAKVAVIIFDVLELAFFEAIQSNWVSTL